VGGLLLLLAGLALLFADGRTRRTSGRRAAGRPTPAAGIPVQSPPTPDDGRRPDVVDLRDVPDAPTAVDAGPVDRPGDR
jgi:hypothetical protein